MSKKEKLIKRLLSVPKDFTDRELEELFGLLGYELQNKGKTSGSRIEFVKDNLRFDLHKPHPDNIIKIYVIKNIIKFLKEHKEID